MSDPASRSRALYLLHGLTGDYMDWSTRTDLARLAREVPLVIVMPDGENAWYTNAADKGPRFEDYIADDLVKDVEKKYRVIRSRYGRAIAGLSMGGYGALKIGLKRPGTFIAAGGFSSALGVTDPKFADRLARYRDQLNKIYGAPDSETRTANDILLIAEKLEAGAGASASTWTAARRGRADRQQPGAGRSTEQARDRLRVPRGPGRAHVGLLEPAAGDFLPWLMRAFTPAAAR